MGTKNYLQELQRLISSGEIINSSKEDLEKYIPILCTREAYDALGDKPFPQVCETTRLLLFKKYLEDINKRNTFVQYIIIALMVLTIVVGGVQIYVALSPKQPTVAMQPETPKTESSPMIQKAPVISK